MSCIPRKIAVIIVSAVMIVSFLYGCSGKTTQITAEDSIIPTTEASAATGVPSMEHTPDPTEVIITESPTESPTPAPTEMPTPEPTLKPVEEFPLPDDPDVIGDCIRDAEILAYLPFDDKELGLGFAGEFEIDVYMRKPEAFWIKDGKAYVLDSVKNRVIVCEKEGYSFITFSDADVWNYYMTMAIVDDRIYVCNTEEEMDCISVYDMSGAKLESIRVPKKAYKNGVSALFEMDGHLAMYDHGLVLYDYTDGEFVERYDIAVEGVGKPELNITAGDKHYWLNAGKSTMPGIIRIIDDRVYCWVRELDIGGYSYRVYTAEGELLGATSLDVENVLGYADSPMFITPEGNVYLMCCMKDGVYITEPHLRTEQTLHLDVIIDAGY